MIIVPVMVSYDRIFEHTNLASEMISGEKHDYNLLTTLWNVFKRKENQMGDVYIKYLKPIHIDKFAHKHYPEGLKSPDTFKRAAIQLTECLLKLQEENTPINLNSIIASCILQ